MRKSPYLDLARRASRIESTAARAGWTGARVVSITSDGEAEIRLDGMAGDDPPIVMRVQQGTWAPGAVIRVLQNDDGRVVIAEPPLETPSSEDVVHVGDSARRIAEHEAKVEDMRSRWLPAVEARLDAQQGATAEAIDAAKQELSAAASELEDELRAAENAIAGARAEAAQAAQSAASASTAAGQAKSKAQAASTAAGEAKSKAQSAASAAAGASSAAQAAQGRADEAKTQAATAQSAATAAQSKAQAAEREAKTGKVATSRLIPGNVLIGGNLIALGAVTAEKITASAALWAKIASFAKVTTQMLVAGGAKITGPLLAETIDLSTAIRAGNPQGTHTILDPQGLRVMRRLQNGQVVEAARLGSSSNDYLGITDSNGTLVASISDAGGGSFSTLAAGESLIYRGREMADILALFPGGVIAMARGDAFQPTLSNVHGRYGLVELAFPWQYSGKRALKISAGFTLRQWGKHANVEVTMTQNGSRPLVTSKRILSWSTPATAGGTDYSVNHSGVTVIDAKAGDMIKLLLMISSGASGNIAFVNGNEPYFIVEDLGPLSVNTGAVSSGGGTLPGGGSSGSGGSKSRRVLELAASWGASYDINGNRDHYAGERVVQGYYPGQAARMGMMGFPSLSQHLSGAQIESVEVYLHFDHWYYHSGGTAVLGVHAHANVPARWDGTTGQAQASGMPKPGGRWIRLPSDLYAGFRSGAYKGVTLRAPGDTTDQQYYGYANRHHCKIRVVYYK